ncbi:MAG: 2'-5' RNA ligase family protein [Nitrosopumilus sp.]|nr:2'-5' RNA ligase family protein [Nitrosopumilus sp.]
MTHYLIEFRFSGYAKQSIKELKSNITKNFGVTRRKIVPHITLAGPVYTRHEKRLVKEIVDICKKYDLVKFKIDGFDNFENRVIYVRINPSEELERLRLEIAERLYKFCDTTKFDNDEKFTFHATLVLKDIQRKFNRIWDYLQTWRIPEMEQYVLRITIIKNQRILAEYDLILKKLLNRAESLDKDIHKKTIKKLDSLREHLDRKFEDVTNQKVHFISDTHFDHRNILRYCNRPFNSIRQMNQTLVENWCNSVRKNEKVFFLGDMSYGKDRRPIDYWLGKLTGKISYIRGNHDKDIINHATVIHSHYGIKYNNYQFLLMHDPHRPNGYDGWIIHGDKHNNNLKDYPFVNQKNKTVNVCAELVDYVPISLDRIIELIETGRKYNTSNG